MALTEGKPALTGRALGLVLIFLTAIIWVAASFVSQLLVTNEEGRTNFNVPPFLLTYLSTSVFTIFLPLVQIKSLLQETWLLRRSFKYKPLQEDEESALINTATRHRLTDPAAAAAAAEDTTPSCNGTSTAAAAAGGAGGGGLSGLTADLDTAEAAAAADAASAAARASRAAHKEALTAAAQCFLLWFAAQFLFNQSLSLTSVTSNTILSSTSSLFTFALSMAFLKEPYSAAKMASIAACIGGTLLVTLSDDSSSGSSGGGSSSSVRGSSLAAAIAANSTAATPSASPPTSSSSSGGPSHSVWGDLLCLVSAAFYACYTIVLRKTLPDDDEANVALFFGYVGLLCSVVFAPVVALLAGVGALHLKAIPSKAYLIILVQGILNYCLSDYLWAHAVLLLGPTIATLGLSVQIPVAAVVEALIGHPKWLSSGAAMAMTLSGTGLIMAGFVAGNLAGGGRVYGSHHRDDGAGLQGDTCSSIHGLADDSFSQRSSSSSSSRSPPPPHSRTNGFSGTHTLGPGSSSTSSRSSPERARHTLNSHSHPSLYEGDDNDDDMPQSPLLHHTKQQQVSHFDREAGGLTVPVSTHASIRLSNAGGGSSSSPRNSSPGRPLRSPRQAVAAAAAGVLARGCSSPHQQQLRQPQQHWESIELSSSFGSEGQKSDQGSPSALLGLRPSEQLPQQQRSPLGTHSSNNSSSSSSSAQQDAAAGAAAAQSPPPQLPPAAAGAGGAGVDLLSFDASTPQQQQQQER